MAGGPLEIVDETAFPGRDKQNRLAGATGATGATDAVHVGLAVERHVVIDHQTDPVHIQTPGRHIGGHQNVDRSAAQPLHGSLPLVLRHITIEHSNLMAAGFQGFRNGERDGLGAGKDDHPFAAAGIQHPLQRLQLVGHWNGDRALANAPALLILRADRHFRRIFEITLGKTTNLRRHRGREQHHLTLLRQLAEDPFDVVDEAHPQHLIGFVQHKAAKTRGVEGALAHVVHHPPRGTHHHINATPQGTDLRAEIGAAVHRQHLQVRMACGIGLERISHLHGQLTGRGQHQNLWCFLTRLKPFEQRQRKGCGLTGSRLRLAHQVTTEHQVGERRLLNR